MITHDQVRIGDALPPLTYDVTSTSVVLGALAARDWRPMHHDYHFAVERQGVKDIFLNSPNQGAWLEPSGGFGPNGVQLAATADGDGWRLDGVKRHVGFARAADRLLVLARTAEGPSLLLVDPQAAGVTLTQLMTISSDTQ